MNQDETPNNSDVSPRFKLFDTQTTFSPTLSHIETLCKFKQIRNLADDNLFGGPRVIALSLINSYTLTVHFMLVCQRLFGDNYF